MTATNNGGASGSYNLTDTLTVPAGVTAMITAAPAYGTGTDGTNGAIGTSFGITGGSIVTGENLAAGQAETWVYTLTYETTTISLITDNGCDGSTPDVVKVNNAASLDGGTSSVQACVDVPLKADIVITKAVAPTTDAAGIVTAIYTVTAINNGGASGSYDLTDTLTVPAGVTATLSSSPAHGGQADGVSGTTGAFTIAGGTIITGENLAAGETETWVYTLTYETTDNSLTTDDGCNAATPDVITVDNAASLDGGTTSQAACVDVPLKSDISITKSVSTSVDAAGIVTATYLITATNAGGASGSYDLTDAVTVPAGVTAGITSAPAHSGADGTDGTVTPAFIINAAGSAIVTGENLAATSIETWTYIVTYTADTSAVADNGCNTTTPNVITVDNAASLDGGTTNVQACVDVPLQAGITLEKTVSASEAAGVVTAIYTIKATNGGGAPGSYDLTDTITVPAGVTATITAAPAHGGETDGTDGTLGVFAIGANSPIVTGENLAAGADETWVYTLTYETTDSALTTDMGCNTTTPDVITVDNAASLDAGVTSVQACVDVPLKADINLTKAVVPNTDPVTGTVTAVYTITATNAGGASGSYDLLDAITVPAGVTAAITSAPAHSGADGTDGTVNPTFIIQSSGGGSAIVTGENLAAGAVETWAYTLTYTADNTAVSDGGCMPTTPDVITVDNQASIDFGDTGPTACVDVPLLADISITKSVSTSTDATGLVTAVYTITASNAGAGSGSYFLTDAIIVPAGVTAVLSVAPAHGGEADGTDGTTGAFGSVGGIIVSGETLAAGEDETWVYTLTYITTDSSLATDNGCNTTTPDVITVNNTATLDGGITTVQACADVPLLADIQIIKSISSIDKSFGNAALLDKGDKIQYSFVVENTGNVTLDPISVTDPMVGTVTCDDTSLAVGAQTNCLADALYELTQGDVNLGGIENSATATGQPPTPVGGVQPPVVDDVSDTGTKPEVDGTVTTISSPEGVETPSPIGGLTNSGDPEDDPTTLLIPIVPELSIDKKANATTGLAVGDTVTYTYVVTNTGNVIMTDVFIADTHAGLTNSLSAVAGESLTTNGGDSSDAAVNGTIDALAPGDVAEFTSTYVVSQADVDAGVNGTTIDNTATANGTPPPPPTTLPPGVVFTPPTDTESVTPVPPAPAYSLDKSAAAPSVDQGVDNALIDKDDTILYTFVFKNTGNVTLDNVLLTDPLLDPIGNPTGCVVLSTSGVFVNDATSSLAVGETITCTATYVLLQADIDAGKVDNTATISGDVPNGDPLPPKTDSVTTPLPRETSIELLKVAALPSIGAGNPAITDAGDTIVYSFDITNTGNVTLTDVTLTDQTLSLNITCPTNGNGSPFSLAAGATETCTATYTITAADMLGTPSYATIVGSTVEIANTADVIGTPPAGSGLQPPTSISSALAKAQLSGGIALVKSAGVINDVDSNGSDAGDIVTYTYTVTNTGTADLTAVTVTEDAGLFSGTGADPIPGNEVLLTDAAPTGDTIDASQNGSYDTLGAGDTITFTATYTLTQLDIDAGELKNTAKATGTPPIGMDPPESVSSVVVKYPQNASIEIVKSIGTIDITKGDASLLDALDEIQYNFVVTNTSNVTISAIDVSDSMVGTVTCVLTSLAGGASTTCTADNLYVLTQPDVDAGGVENTATVTGQPATPVGGPQPPVVTDISDAGTKPNPNGTVTPEPTPGVTETPSPLGTNTNLPGDPKEDPTTLLVPPKPDIAVLKSITNIDITKGNAVIFDADDEITYEFVVTNTGNVSLDPVAVSDAMVGAITCPAGALAPNANVTCTADAVYVLTTDDVNAGGIENTATATGTGPTPVGGGTPPVVTDISDTGTKPGPNGTVTDEPTPGITDTPSPINVLTNLPDPEDDPTTVLIPPMPSIEIIKSIGTIDVTKGNSNTLLDADDEIEYTFVVTNTGNVKLDPVSVTDTMVGTVTCDDLFLDAGASTNCTADALYVLTQPDVDAGGVENRATATGTPPLLVGGGIPVDVTDISDAGTKPEVDGSVTTITTPPSTTETPSPIGTNTNVPDDPEEDPTTLLVPPKPDIAVLKSITNIDITKGNAAIFDTDDEITYEFVVTNTGNVSLDPVTVMDSKVGVTCPAGALAPAASVTCTADAAYVVTTVDVNAGGVENTATATGTGPTPVGGGTPPVVTDISDTGTKPGPNGTVTTEPTPVITDTPSPIGVLGNPPTTEDDPTTVLIPPLPSIEIIKSIGTIDVSFGANPLKLDALDKIEYTFEVTNTGNVKLDPVSVSDSMVGTVSCLATSLEAGVSTSCTADALYVLTVGDVNAGGIENTATAKGTPPTPVGGGTPVDVTDVSDAGTEPDPNVPGTVITVGTPGITDTPSPIGVLTNTPDPEDDPTTLLIPSDASIEIIKSIGTIDITKGIATILDALDEIQYNFVVTNTGNVKLDPVSVSDSMVGSVTCNDSFLDAGAFTNCTADALYVLTPGDVNAGGVENTATATGTPPLLVGGGIPVDVTDISDAGTKPEPNGTVTTEPTPGITDTPSPIGVLTNTPDPEDDPTTLLIPSVASIEIIKSIGTIDVTKGADASLLDALDEIEYTFVVTNTGNVKLDPVSVTDTLVGSVTCDDASLDAGASTNCVADALYVLTLIDVNAGGIENTATATGTPPTPVGGGTPVDVTDVSDTGTKPEVDGTVTTVTTPETTDTPNPIDVLTNTSDPQDDPTTLLIPPSPKISLLKKIASIDNTKGLNSAVLDADDEIQYSFVVTNTGNVSLDSISIIDATIGSISCVATQLDPGDSTDCTADALYVLTQIDVDAGGVENTATVTGTPPLLVGGGTPVDVMDVSDAGTQPGPNGTVTTVGDPINTNTLNPLAVFTNTGDPEDDPTTILIPELPEITLLKTADDISDVVEGQTLVYTYTVKNTGNVTLTNVNVTDVHNGAGILGVITPASVATLAPGASADFTASYTVTQADIDADADITNTGTATGTPPNLPPVTVDSPEVVDVVDFNPEIDLIKQAGTPTKVDGADDQVTDAGGDTISYTFVFTNTGNVTLSNVELTDPLVTITNCMLGTTPYVNDGSANLGVGESVACDAVYAIVQQDIDDAERENTATVKADDPKGDPVPPVSVTVTTPLEQSTSILLLKKPDQSGLSTPAQADDVLKYDFDVTNTGTVTLTDVTVEDETLGVVPFSMAIDCGAGTNIIASMASNTTVTCTGSYILTQNDLDGNTGLPLVFDVDGSGDFTLINKANVVGTPPNGSGLTPPTSISQAEIISGVSTAISLLKTASVIVDKDSDGEDSVDDEITYTFAVKNEGTVTLDDVTVTDEAFTGTGSNGTLVASNAQITANTSGNSVLGTDPTKIAVLAPGDEGEFTVVYVLTQDDVDAGKLDNTASATGTPNPPVIDPPKSISTVSVPIEQNPGFNMVKTVDATVVDSPTTLTYTFEFTNNGNVRLNDVTLTDANIDAGSLTGCPIAVLEVDETLSCTATRTITQDDIDAGADLTNTGLPTAKDPKGNDVPEDHDGDPLTPNDPTDNSTATPVDQKPSIEIVKSIASFTIDKGAESTILDADDEVTYSFVVTNTGNVTLDPIAVTDPKVSNIMCTPTKLAPNQSTTSCTADVYVITAADLIVGAIENTAEVSGLPPQVVGSGTPPVAVTDVSDSGTDDKGDTIPNPETTETVFPIPNGGGTNTSDPKDDPTPLDLPPVAIDDENLGNPPGSSVLVDLVGNDIGGDIDPTSVKLIIPAGLPTGTTLSTDGKTITVPGQGVWVVDTNGQVRFTPEVGYYGDPTPIDYTVDDNNGNTSNIATITVTYVTTASIVSRVWNDSDKDGNQDGNEDGIPNVVVELLDGGGNVIGTTITDSNGQYVFDDLTPGVPYSVRIPTPPAGLTETYDEDGKATPHIIEDIVLTPLEEYSTAHFGYAPPAGSIGDVVWADTDGNGVQDPGELGIPGVTVTLYDETGGVVSTTTTDAQGHYLFPGVGDGTHGIGITPPAGYTSHDKGDPDVRDGSSTTADNQTTVVLSGGGSNMDADFGLLPPAGTDITGTVYTDVAGNGVLDAPTDAGIPNVSVSLVVDVDGNGVFDPNIDTILTTIPTDGNGGYTFSDVPNGDYLVVVTDGNGILNGTTQTGDPDPQIDGAHPVTVTGTPVTDIDFGYQQPLPADPAFTGVIAGNIFLDGNNDGTNSGEGLEGTIVQLKDKDGNLVATAITDENGNYIFTNLYAGPGADYEIVVAQLPVFGDPSDVASGVSPTVDPDPAANTPHTAKVSLSIISPVVIDQDFAYIAPTPNSLTGTLWNDENGDGIQDSNEPEVYANVTLELRDDKGNVIQRVTTDGNGDYTFAGLPDGKYVVVVTDQHNVLAGFEHTQDGAGDSQVDDETSKNDQGYAISLAGGVNPVIGDFGYQAILTTPITLGSFTSEALGVNEVKFSWTTFSEIANVGFLIYQKVDGQWASVNDALIPAVGESVEIQHYAFTAQAVSGSEFVLVDVDSYGEQTVHGPFALGESFGQPDKQASPAANWSAIAAPSERDTQKRQRAKEVFKSALEGYLDQ